MNEFFDKEEWANRKQQDRESAYAIVDDALKKVGTDGKAFQTYLGQHRINTKIRIIQ